MIPLDVLDTKGDHDLFTQFATDSRPLRPSKLGSLLQCTMSVFLSINDGDERSNPAADTGSLVHSGAAAYHKTTGAQAKRVEAGQDAILTQTKFPLGDKAKASQIFAQYAQDPKNQAAITPWVEEKVRLVLSPADIDPTGLPVVIEGTLDQVRYYPDDPTRRVWDIKTGVGKDAEATKDEHAIQQACYTLAARQTLSDTIEPGGYIYTPGYDKPRGRRHLSLDLTVDDCRMLMASVVLRVALIRRGVPLFSPSYGACLYCPVRPYKSCISLFRGAYQS